MKIRTLTNDELLTYWEQIPYGKENALSYDTLCANWNTNKRNVRLILNRLSRFDDGSDLILIRSSNRSGFYKSDNQAEIKEFKKECLNRGRNCFAPIKKINRVLKEYDDATFKINIINNLSEIRLAKGYTMRNALAKAKGLNVDLKCLDMPLLSKFERGVCLPTKEQIEILAKVYDVEPQTLFAFDIS